MGDPQVNESRLFHPGNNLLILLDISRSMQADDVAPTRLGRARQEIQDLIMQNRRLRLGLIAFASLTPMIFVMLLGIFRFGLGIP